MRASFSGPKPRLFGHRGAAGLAPENTLVSFRRARHEGADIFEIDVHATADGEIVVIHDPTLDRTSDGVGPVASLSVAQLARVDAGFRFTPDGGRTFPYRGRGVKVPLLVDLMREFPDVPLNIEIKQGMPEIVTEVVALVRRARAPVVLAAEHDAIMRQIRSVSPDIPTSLAAGEVAAFIAAIAAGERPMLPEGAVALQVPPRFGDVTLVSAVTVAAAHALGAEVHVWTINDAEEMRALIALGCDGIITDFPGLARAVIDEAVSHG
jgi:glycerophosphoryl diester phosphodiesterase